MQVVVFTLNKEEYGLPVDNVDEIIRFREPTEIPKAPKSVLGILNLRDRIIPVMSLRKVFDFSYDYPTEETRIIVCDYKQQLVGCVVDSVIEVLEIEPNSIESTQSKNRAINEKYTEGIAKLSDRLIIILDLNYVLESITQGSVAC